MSPASTKSSALPKPRRAAKSSAAAAGVSSSAVLARHKAAVVLPAAVRRKAADRDAPAIVYRPRQGVDAYVRQVASATPVQMMHIERTGVLGSFIKDLSKRMELPASRVFSMLGVPKATAEKKAAAGEMLSGRGGQAAVGMVKLLGIAQDIVANSTAGDARGFDAAKWLGQWIERAQPSLGGRKPAELLDTPTGAAVVARLLGSIESGAYQ